MNHTENQSSPESLSSASVSIVNSLFTKTEAPSVWALSGKIIEDADSQFITISENRLTIGRHSNNGLQLSDPTVSGQHAELLQVNSDIFVRDLNSTNGTLLNGRRINELTGLRAGDILHFGSVMLVLHQTELPHRCDTVVSDSGVDAIAHVQFDSLIHDPAIEPVFQPIVDLKTRSIIAFELLSRSQLFGLETPEKMFRIATQRQSAVALSRVCRIEGLRAAQQFNAGTEIYLNTHPEELGRNSLFDSLRELRHLYPDERLCLEVHEAGVTSTTFLRELRRMLDDLGIGLAYDDFGAGQARLLELIEVPPDVLKFDLKLVQSLPDATDQQLSTIESLLRIVHDLDVIVLAEGIETEQQAAICQQVGFDTAQGFLYGRGTRIENWLETFGSIKPVSDLPLEARS